MQHMCRSVVCTVAAEADRAFKMSVRKHAYDAVVAIVPEMEFASDRAGSFRSGNMSLALTVV